MQRFKFQNSETKKIETLLFRLKMDFFPVRILIHFACLQIHKKRLLLRGRGWAPVWISPQLAGPNLPSAPLCLHRYIFSAGPDTNIAPLACVAQD